MLLLSTLMATAKAVFCKAIGTDGNTKREKAILNFKSFLVAFLVSLFFVIGRIDEIFEISSFSLFLSVFFGLSVAFTQLMQSKAMGCGPSSTVTLVYAAGFLIPIFYGIIFWGESVSHFQWLGVILLTVALTLCVLKKEKKRRLITWLPFAAFAMLGSGANAILQKTHQLSEFSDEISFYLVYALFFSALFTGLISPFIREDKTAPPCKINNRERILKKILLPALLGASVGILNFLNLTLSGKLPSVIHFPIYNVGSMLLISLICAIVYKEKTTAVQKIGFALGIIAILIIGLL